MGLATGLSAGLGIVGGISNMISGAKEKRDAENALENYQRQELKNVAEGLQVSTLSSDLQREEQSRLASGQIQAARESGTRGMIGSLGRIEAGNQRVMRETGANLDMQQKQIDQIQAEDDARIRGMQENREQNDINALSSQYQAGKQEMFGGFGNIIQGTGMLGGAFGKMGGGQGNQMPQVENANQLQPQGVVPFQQKMQTTPYPTSQFGQFGQGIFAQPNPYVTQQY
jgi:hypothetical protein